MYTIQSDSKRDVGFEALREYDSRTPNLNTQVGTSPNYSWDDCQVGSEHES